MSQLPSLELIVDSFLEQIDVSILDVYQLRQLLKEHIRQNFLPFFIYIIDSMGMMRQIFQEICRRGNWVLQMPDKKQYAVFSYQHGMYEIQKYFNSIGVDIEDPTHLFVGSLDGTHVYHYNGLIFYMIPRN